MLTDGLARGGVDDFETLLKLLSIDFLKVGVGVLGEVSKSVFL